jgi:hypothetical protein
VADDADRLDTCEASTQLRPESAAPMVSSRRGPKRSTRKPCAGERNVCTTISSEKVTCAWASVEPSASVTGRVKSAQTYCGLAIITIDTTPIANCHWRLARAGADARWPSTAAGAEAARPGTAAATR